MMATYFNGGGSEIQADNLQTLYLMNPSYSSAYSDAPPPPPGMFLLNPATHALNPGSLQHAPPQHLVGIPLHQSGSASPSSLPEIPGFAPRFHNNLSGGGGGVCELGSSVGFRRPPPVTVAASTSLDHHQQKQQLSLCLNNSPANKVTSPCGGGGGGTPTSASGVSTGGGQQSGIVGSKYMKAAQQLLDETVNVWKAMSMADSGREKAKADIDSAGGGGGGGGGGGAGETSGGLKKEVFAAAAELSTAQRQELQMKKAKLLNMVDEVEQRYRQYHSQMQAVASSLEQATGLGSAKSYTALALHTISKQFRCLKDAIESQIKETGRSLGEEGEGKRESRSRLRMVDQQMRQQLSVMHQQHQNAWRPQRGLPERAVSVLRAWLFEHFLHPYPKDSDKHMLAKQTGLTRSQVSNWFINARVRLWKPMVEEMYLEETKGVQQQNESDDHKNNKDSNKDSSQSSKSTPTLQSPRIPQNPNSINHIPNSTLISPPSASTGPTLHGLGPALQGFSLAGMESSKRQRSNTVIDIQNDPQSSILSMDHQIEMKDINTHHGGFGSNYSVGDIGSRFNPDHHHHHHQLQHGHYHQAGNSVSLTLGLPHCENLLSSLSSTHHQYHQQNFMPGQAVQLGRRPDIGIGETEFCTSHPSHSGVGGGGGGGGYEGVDIQNRKRFAAQLLSDFVA